MVRVAERSRSDYQRFVGGDGGSRWFGTASGPRSRLVTDRLSDSQDGPLTPHGFARYGHVTNLSSPKAGGRS